MTKLREARTKAGLSQEYVSRQTKLSDLGYRNYEKGRRLPRVDKAIEIAETLGTTVEAIWKKEA